MDYELYNFFCKMCRCFSFSAPRIHTTSMFGVNFDDMSMTHPSPSSIMPIISSMTFLSFLRILRWQLFEWSSLRHIVHCRHRIINLQMMNRVIIECILTQSIGIHPFEFLLVYNAEDRFIPVSSSKHRRCR